MTILDTRAAMLRPAQLTRPKRASTVAVHLMLIAFVLVAVAPVILIVLNSFKNQRGIFEGPLALPDSSTFSLAGYSRVFRDGNFLGYYANSLIVTIVATGLVIVCSTLAAYALTEYRVWLAPLLTGFFLIGMMLPIRLGTVPLLQMMVSWGLFNTRTALVLVYTGMNLPLAIAVMMVYFRSVPRELKEAAHVDGAGELRTLMLITPLVRPALAAVAAITMLPIWNDLWFPLILAPGQQTVTLGVQQFVGQFTNDWPSLLAALTIGALPLIILFTIFSRQFIQGLSQGMAK